MPADAVCEGSPAGGEATVTGIEPVRVTVLTAPGCHFCENGVANDEGTGPRRASAER
jgi:hypothetical protein